VFWMLRTGAPWRDLPPDDGDGKQTPRRFCRWRARGVWEALLEQLVDAPDFAWRMIDASHSKVPPPAAGAKGGHQAMHRTNGGSTPSCIWPWMRMVCRSESLLRKVPQRMVRRLAVCWRALGQSISWQTAGRTAMPSSSRRSSKGCRRLCRPASIETYSGNTTQTSIGCVTLLQTLFCTSSAGGVLQRDMPKILRHFLRQSKFVASHFGPISCDDTI
jgi:Putative transposase of IS4/5 family (DUF4096)